MGRRGRPPYPDLLTPRQQEVLTLVREGMTNREIAEHLDITPDGAKFHVSEILTKIGVSSREEAARWRADVPTATLHQRSSRWSQSARPSRMIRWRGIQSNLDVAQFHRSHSRGRLCYANRQHNGKLSIT